MHRYKLHQWLIILPPQGSSIPSVAKKYTPIQEEDKLKLKSIHMISATGNAQKTTIFQKAARNRMAISRL